MWPTFTWKILPNVFLKGEEAVRWYNESTVGRRWSESISTLVPHAASTSFGLTMKLCSVIEIRFLEGLDDFSGGLERSISTALNSSISSSVSFKKKNPPELRFHTGRANLES